MEFKVLYIWIEGQDDKRFFENIITPICEKKYHQVKLIEYSSMKKKKVIQFLHSINSMSADYYFISDIDNFPCVLSKKQHLLEKFNDRLDQERVIVVIKEIESWYKAGLDENQCSKLKIPVHEKTDQLTKETFNQLIPNNIDRLTFMLDILKCFSIDTAFKKNKSFKYYLKKHVLC